MEHEPRQIAVVLSRVRAVLGLTMLALPGLVGRISLGRGAASGSAKALTRMVGGRDLVLGVGALTSLNETQHGPEWMAMAAVADGVDGAALLLGRGLPARARLLGLIAGAAAATNLYVSRALADERESESPALPPEIAPTLVSPADGPTDPEAPPNGQ